MKTLHLTVTKEPFEVMVTGEKSLEFRKPTKWIKQRMFFPNGTPKKYDVVKITNGYNGNRPKFTAKFLGFFIADDNKVFTYSNGLVVNVKKSDVIIHLGQITKIENYAN